MLPSRDFCYKAITLKTPETNAGGDDLSTFEERARIEEMRSSAASGLCK